MKTKTFLLMLLAMICLHAGAKDYKYETVKGDLLNTRIYTLDNGLKVFLSVNKEQPRIQTFIAVKTGSKNDPAETTGLAHYLEHLMFKGTKQFGTNNPAAEQPLLDEIEKKYEEYRFITDPALRKQKYHEIDSISQLAARYFIPNEYDKLMAAIGAEGTNAYTSNDVTCYTEDIPSNEIENWAKIQSDRFQNMVIRGFHTELEAVYEEYNIGLSNDQRKLFTALCAMLYPTHPYGTQTTIGTQEHLKNPSITNIKKYYNKWYVPNNCAVCMSGDFDPDQTIAIIDKYFSSWKPGNDIKQPVFPAMKPITSPRDTTVIGQEAETLWMGWRFDKAASLQTDTLDLIGDILNNGSAGLMDIDLNQSMKLLGSFAGSESLADHGGFIMAGTPKEGQSLDEVRQLLLGELDKLKSGNFSDDLLPAIVNNMKLQYYRSMENNEKRANQFVDAFINNIPWEQAVGKIDRISKITKDEVVAFANKHFGNNYVAIYKRQGVDPNQKKIDKPAITPIPTNRDQMSQFVKDIQQSEVAPIQPRFVDFNKDMVISKTKKKLPMLYKQNTENGLFTLAFHYEFGTQADNRYDIAADYIDYLGTDKLSATQIKEEFYKLACNYNIGVGARSINITLNGLDENMPAALKLLENFLKNAKVDKDAYQQYVELLLKSRANGKNSQRSNFSALQAYGIYGPYNSQRNIMSEQQLKETDPQTLLDLLKNISNYKHTVMYYGPQSEAALSKLITANHKTIKKLADVPVNKEYQEQQATTNEIMIAPYDAKNIYMVMYHNENRTWNPEETAVKTLFNEYFGGGMNGIVFQELREARGLAYSAAANYRETTLKGHSEYYYTYIITQNDKMTDCMNEFHNILNNMPASESAFRIAKDATIKRLASQRTTKFAVLNAYVNAKLMGLDYDINKKIYEIMPSLQLKDIVNFEKNLMANKQYRYLILGDEKNLDMKALEKIGPIKRVSTEEIFGY